MDATELGPVTWTKSTRSGVNGNCVEVARLDAGVAVRDSKDPQGPVLVFTSGEWGAFVEGVKNGEMGL